MNNRAHIFPQFSGISMGLPFLMDPSIAWQVKEIKITVHNYVKTHSVPWFPLYDLHKCLSILTFWFMHKLLLAFWSLLPSFSPLHGTGHSVARTVTTPSSAPLTLKVPPGEANLQHSCPPKGNKQTNSFHILLTIITKIIQRGNAWRKEHSADWWTVLLVPWLVPWLVLLDCFTPAFPSFWDLEKCLPHSRNVTLVCWINKWRLTAFYSLNLRHIKWSCEPHCSLNVKNCDFRPQCIARSWETQAWILASKTQNQMKADRLGKAETDKGSQKGVCRVEM